MSTSLLMWQVRGGARLPLVILSRGRRALRVRKLLATPSCWATVAQHCSPRACRTPMYAVYIVHVLMPTVEGLLVIALLPGVTQLLWLLSSFAPYGMWATGLYDYSSHFAYKWICGCLARSRTAVFNYVNLQSSTQFTQTNTINIITANRRNRWL